jgi:hypothetical protein
MRTDQLHYLPLAPAFFSILVGIFLVVLGLIRVGRDRGSTRAAEVYRNFGSNAIRDKVN